MKRASSTFKYPQVECGLHGGLRPLVLNKIIEQPPVPSSTHRMNVGYMAGSGRIVLNKKIKQPPVPSSTHRFNVGYMAGLGRNKIFIQHPGFHWAILCWAEPWQ